MNQSIARYLGCLLLLLGLLGTFSDTLAQGQESQITFTGIITGGKNSEPLPLARIFIPRAGKGYYLPQTGILPCLCILVTA